MVTAAVGAFDGSLTTLRPFERAASGEPNPTYRCLFPSPPPEGQVPTCAEAGVLGALTGILGAMMALEVIPRDRRLRRGVGGPPAARRCDVDALRDDRLSLGTPDNPLNGRGA